MKASELIKQLEKLIEMNGDIEVVTKQSCEEDGELPSEIKEVSITYVQENINEVGHQLEDRFSYNNNYPNEWIKSCSVKILID